MTTPIEIRDHLVPLIRDRGQPAIGTELHTRVIAEQGCRAGWFWLRTPFAFGLLEYHSGYWDLVVMRWLTEEASTTALIPMLHMTWHEPEDRPPLITAFLDDGDWVATCMALQ